MLDLQNNISINKIDENNYNYLLRSVFPKENVAVVSIPIEIFEGETFFKPHIDKKDYLTGYIDWIINLDTLQIIPYPKGLKKHYLPRHIIINPTGSDFINSKTKIDDLELDSTNYYYNDGYIAFLLKNGKKWVLNLRTGEYFLGNHSPNGVDDIQILDNHIILKEGNVINIYTKNGEFIGNLVNVIDKMGKFALKHIKSISVRDKYVYVGIDNSNHIKASKWIYYGIKGGDIGNMFNIETKSIVKSFLFGIKEKKVTQREVKQLINNPILINVDRGLQEGLTIIYTFRRKENNYIYTVNEKSVFYNFVDVNGNLLPINGKKIKIIDGGKGIYFNDGYDDVIESFKNNIAIVKYKGKFYLLNKDGHFVSDGFNSILRDKSVFVGLKNNKLFLLDYNGNILYTEQLHNLNNYHIKDIKYINNGIYKILLNTMEDSTSKIILFRIDNNQIIIFPKILSDINVFDEYIIVHSSDEERIGLFTLNFEKIDEIKIEKKKLSHISVFKDAIVEKIDGDIKYLITNKGFKKLDVEGNYTLPLSKKSYGTSYDFTMLSYGGMVDKDNLSFEGIISLSYDSFKEGKIKYKSALSMYLLQEGSRAFGWTHFFAGGVRKIEKDGKINFIDIEGNILLDKWIKLKGDIKIIEYHKRGNHLLVKFQSEDMINFYKIFTIVYNLKC